jgi:hypothetical protein
MYLYVTLAPPVPKHWASMSHSCSSSDMAGTSKPYPRRRARRRTGITGHGNLPGTLEHQGLCPGYADPDGLGKRVYPRVAWLRSIWKRGPAPAVTAGSRPAACGSSCTA